LFAGCGGLSLGLEQAGFTPVFVNELTQDAMNTYLLNRLEHYPWLQENKEHDVKELVKNPYLIEGALARMSKEKSVTDIDLLVGGPPCQGYSGIGHRRSYAVDKKQLPANFLYEDMAFLIHLVQPKIFMFENVRGLLNARWTSDGKKGEIWEDVCDTLSAVPGYHFETALVYAKDYGVPQNRPRILGVGIRKDVYRPQTGTVANGYLPEPTGGYPSIEGLFSDLEDENYLGGPTTRYPSAAKSDIQKLLRRDPTTGRVRAKGSPLTEHEYSKHSEKIVAKFEAIIESGGNIPHNMRTKKFAQRLLRREWGPEGPNITATSLPDDYVHYCQPRSLTVREWARLQMFPDWYQFSGKRTTGGLRRAGNPQKGVFDREAPKYTQIGNAVPVRLAEVAGRHFIDILNRSSGIISPKRGNVKLS
jgi:DNA (cytosine-5)-methyltransferase 1